MTDRSPTDRPEPAADPQASPADIARAASAPHETAVDDAWLVLQSQRADAEAALAEQKDKYLRLAAEFENFRKRAAREREHAERHGQGTVIRGLLEGLDDLARFAHLDTWNTEVETVVDGARMVEQKLLKSLAGHGLDVVNPAGQPFDPAFHEAVSTVATDNAAEDNLIAQVFQVGYVFNGQLLRPARVVVKQYAGS